MRFPLVALCLLLVSALPGFAERNHLKPTDLEPLTTVPWDEPDATMEKVLDAIFRETNAQIRYPVLVEYLRFIPVEQMGRAFDCCIALEGTEKPNRLVELMIAVWAERAPRDCWKKTQQLCGLVAFDVGWLAYDGWKDRPRIKARNLKALQASPFWLDEHSLTSFPLGVQRSSLGEKERVQLLKEFCSFWFATFHDWPSPAALNAPEAYPFYQNDLIKTLRVPIHELDRILDHSPVESSPNASSQAVFEIALRRKLRADPSEALSLVKKVQEIKRPFPWSAFSTAIERDASGPSMEMLMLWAKLDLAGLIRWATAPDLPPSMGWQMKAFLMSRVGSSTREQWLAEAEAAKDLPDAVDELWEGWAISDPSAAIQAAIEKRDLKLFENAIASAIYGHEEMPENATQSGFETLIHLDFGALPPDILKGYDDLYRMMEKWGEIDIGETARFGTKYILQTGYIPRDGLLRFFHGEDLYPDEEGVLDRTFCALRVWAVFKPAQMKAWIATLHDQPLEDALTWLLKNPWGEDPRLPKSTTAKSR